MTVNLPGKLRPIMEADVRNHRYDGTSDYVLGLILWDIYSHQPHNRTGPIVNNPQWVLDDHVEKLLTLAHVQTEPGATKAYRFPVRAPAAVEAIVRRRKIEEAYRSESAYLVSLIVFALDPEVPRAKSIPHHKLAALLREPRYVRNRVIQKIVHDFDNPSRKWPKGPEWRLTELLESARQLHLPMR